MHQQFTHIAVALTHAHIQLVNAAIALGSIALGSGLMDQKLYGMILAGALLSTALNPLLFSILDRKWAQPRVSAA